MFRRHIAAPTRNAGKTSKREAPQRAGEQQEKRQKRQRRVSSAPKDLQKSLDVIYCMLCQPGDDPNSSGSS